MGKVLENSEGPPTAASALPAKPGRFTAADVVLMRGAIDAVCSELGISLTDAQRRDRVARRIVESYEDGRRAPLYLVSAGLSEHA